MIIKELTISNFKNYSGSNTFNFSNSIDLLEDSDSINLSKNIILIGGLNGSGKTSFVEAIRLCLYGNKINGKPMTKNEYQNYLNDVYAKNGVGEKSFYVSLKILIDGHRDTHIERKFTYQSEEFVEELILKKDDSNLEVVNEDFWSYYVERIIPPNVSQYFLFDGERVRNVISSSESGDYLASAVRDLTGIKDLYNLRKDLLVVRKNIVSKNTKKTRTAVIEKLENKIKVFTDEKNTFINELENKNSKINCLSNKHDFNADELMRITGIDESKVAEIRHKIEEMGAECNYLNYEYSTFCCDKLPFLLMSNLIEDILKQTKLENDSLISKYTSEKLSTIYPEVERKLIGRIDNNIVEDVFLEFIKQLNSSKEHGNAPDVSLEDLRKLESLQRNINEVTNFLSIVERQDYLYHNITVFENILRKRNSNDAMILLSKNNKISQEIISISEEIKNIKKQIEYFEDAIHRLESEKRNEERNTLIGEAERCSILTIDTMLELINKRITSIENETLFKLNAEINAIYPILSNKDDMVKEIHIANDYKLTLRGFKNDLININYISEGEKGILMYSIVYGLIKISGVKMPLIVDSPLGRMDSLHVKNLIKYYYPVVSEQVIILSHDREFDLQCYNLMLDSILYSYTLTNDLSNKVKSGYFGA